ncbi:MAG: hypothetical protein IT174_02825 [Acidobacteria bacterium]|nr:hypothetical protein [Acidobacteriota bacterium]
MRILKPIVLISTFLALTTVCFAQTPAAADPEKEQAQRELNARIVQTLYQIISDASLLRLPQNRALVYTMAGDLYWKFDEKRSRDLFRSAATELLAHNAEFEREKRESTDPYAGLFDTSDVRLTALPLVAKHDPEMAIQMLVQTRPAFVADAMLKANSPDFSSGNAISFSPENQRVRAELEMEQRFAFLAADANPDRAIALIKDSLARGVSNNLLQLLQKLYTKDEKKAADLAGDVIRKFLDTDLARKNDELNIAINFLSFMSRKDGGATETDPKKKVFRFTDAQAKDLANKVVDTFMQPGNSLTASTSLTRAIPFLEKIVPEKVSLLRQKQASYQKNAPSEFRVMQRMERIYDAKTTPEQILAEIPKLQSAPERVNAYQALTNKISQIADEARAKRLIDQIADDAARTRAQEQFDLARISRTAAAGKLEDARKMVGTLATRLSQIQKLVSLAQQYYQKGSEPDIEAANDLMKNARSLINETPEDEDDLAGLMEVVRGYATIEPDSAFRLFEPIVDQMNEVIYASAVLSKYNKRSRIFKNGELLLRTNNGWGEIPLFKYFDQIQLLGKADLERASSLADRFQRADARILVKLHALNGALREDKRPGGQGSPAKR